MPLRFIRQELIEKPEVIDVELVGARLEHHEIKMSIHNMFLCDCGDNWACKLTRDVDGYNDEMGETAPSLRGAMIKAFKKLEAEIEESKLTRTECT